MKTFLNIVLPILTTVDFMDEGAHLDSDGDSEGPTTTVQQTTIQLVKNILAGFADTPVSTPPPSIVVPPSTAAKDLANNAAASPQTNTPLQSTPVGSTTYASAAVALTHNMSPQ